MPISHNKVPRFEVAFSFPAQNRALVRAIASSLAKTLGENKVFYDEWYEAELARVDVDRYIADLFKNESRLVVLFIGGEGPRDPWTSIEWNHIRRLLLETRESDSKGLRLLPLRIGDGDLEGVFTTAIVPDARGRSVGELTDLILARLQLIQAEAPLHTSQAIKPSARDRASRTRGIKTVKESPEVFVSYSWQQETSEPIVDELCAAVSRGGVEVIRDKTHIEPGGRISRFMDRLGSGGCIIVILSDAYLKSEHCMYELYRIYLTANHEDQRFLDRVIPLIDGNIKIAKSIHRIHYAAYWKQERDELDAASKEFGPNVMGQEDYKSLRRMSEFTLYVSDMLAYLNDKCIPRKLDDVKADDFAVVTKLVSKAVR